MPFVPYISAEFSAPPEFSGGVRKKHCAQVGSEPSSFTKQML
jgi:hypothetical protein